MHVGLSKYQYWACASHWWCFIGWILLKSYWLSIKTLEIVRIMKGNRAIEYQKYVVNDFFYWLKHFAFWRGRSWISAIKLQPMVYWTSLNLSLWLIRNFCQRKSYKTFPERPMGSRLANRKWSCYLENWDSSGLNNHLVHFWSHLRLSSVKRLTYAHHFLYLVYSGLRRHFALEATFSG